MTGVTAVMIAYHNEQESLVRLQRDLLPALRDRVEYELVVIDNSAEFSPELADAVSCGKGRYCWQQGENLMYGASLNLAVSLATHPYLLYVCSNHGQSYDDTWALDLLRPLVTDALGDVAMTGTLQHSGSPTGTGFPEGLPPYHIQGGLFAARTSALAAHPYPNGEYAHWGSDIYQCFQLVASGLRLVEVPTVRSVWRESDLGEGAWKYVHNSGWKD
jgi:hypothetical protein